MNKPKNCWENIEFQGIGDIYGYQSTWAAQAIAIQAAKHGFTVWSGALNAELNGNFSELLAAIKELGGKEISVIPQWELKGATARCTVEDSDAYGSFSLNDENLDVSYDLIWDFGMIHLSLDPGNELSCRIVHANEDLFYRLRELVERFAKPKTSDGRVYVLVSGPDGIRLSSLGVVGVAFEPTNYTPQVVKAYKHVIEDLTRSNPCGRIIVLDGEPGTGKSFLVRSIVGEITKGVFIFVQSHMVESLGDPSFIQTLIDAKRKGDGGPVVLILEDADTCLMKRDGQNNGSVSALLNMGDGILGAMMDLRLLCTTNLRDVDLDPAVARPQRLCRKIEIGALSREQAIEVYKRLTHKDLTIKKGDFLTLAEVYRAAIDGGYHPVEDSHKPVGFDMGNGET